ncbi:MAG: patatin-like phospholipase family protein [Planctomycetota bacterium]
MLTLLSLSLALGAAGCGPTWKNARIDGYKPGAGYRLETLKLGRGNSDETFVALCFSGGGTRAAALAFGVLEGLRATAIAPADANSPPRTMLDEVDLISSVSGGSFTSMVYGLDREAIFDGRFERKFLKYNVQTRLLSLVLSPLSIVLLPYALLDRIDLAAEYYHNEVFDRRTYQALLDRGERPLLVVNATNMSIDGRFEFTQDDFDFLGSDLASLPVAHAVAASSAVPLLLSPLRLSYQNSDVIERMMRETLDQQATEPVDPRYRKWARSLLPQDAEAEGGPVRFDAAKHKFLYLLDGGLIDNLGVTHVLHSFRYGALRRMIAERRVRRLCVVIVNASTAAPEPIEDQPRAPGLWMMALKTGTIGISGLSEAMTEALRDVIQDRPRELGEWYDRCQGAMAKDCPKAPPPPQPAGTDVETQVIEINFHRIADAKKRRRFLSMPTSLFLQPGDVDALIDLGRQQLIEDPGYRLFVEQSRDAE